MTYRKDLFGLNEVGAELEQLRVPRWHLTLLSDLQQGVLKAVVQFPGYRQTPTRIPVATWCDDEVERLFRHPGRRGWKEDFDFSLTVNDFYTDEEALLQAALQSASLRETSTLPKEFRSEMTARGLLNADMAEGDWHEAIKWLMDCWQQLADLNGSRRLYPMVEAHQMGQYLFAVKKDRETAGKWSGEKHPGGRPEGCYWPAILEVAVRKLANRPKVLASGEVKEFATHVHTALTKAGVVTDPQKPLPAVATIAQRLREIIKQDQSESIEKPN